MIDPTRWRALLDAYRDAQDASVPLIVLQDAQAALGRARAELERHRSTGPVGHADEHMTPERIEQGYARDIAELTRRVEKQARVVARIDARIKSTAARRNARHEIAEDTRAWAQAENVALPDEPIRPPVMFSSTSVHVPEAPAGSPTVLAPPSPARPGGSGLPPAARTAPRGSVIARVMQELLP